MCLRIKHFIISRIWASARQNLCTNKTCDQPRLRSACASAQSDQSFHWSHATFTAFGLSKEGWTRTFAINRWSCEPTDEWPPWWLETQAFNRSPVAEHFCSTEHDFLNHASLCSLDHNPEWSDRTRKARKSYWIRRLNTLQPYGINKGDQQRESSFLSQGMRQLCGPFSSCDFSGITA